MDFWSINWGDVATAVGVVVSLIGLGWAIKEARGARTASQAAQAAARETRKHIGQYLQATNLERAIALLQRLKLLHRLERWEAALEQYQALRMMLHEVAAHFPESEREPRRRIAFAIRTIEAMENWIESGTPQLLNAREKERLYQQLNEIQNGLESLASTRKFGDFQGEIE